MLLTPGFLAGLFGLSSVVAAPDGSWGTWHRGCLSDAEAAFLTNIFVSFSVSFDPNYAGQFLTNDFTIQSDSANILFNQPLGEVSAPNKTAFIAGSLALTTTVAQAAVTVENIIHSCHEIAYRYKTADTPEIQGMTFLYTQPGTNLIEKAYAEFDNVADLVGERTVPMQELKYCIMVSQCVWVMKKSIAVIQ